MVGSGVVAASCSVAAGEDLTLAVLTAGRADSSEDLAAARTRWPAERATAEGPVNLNSASLNR